MAAELTCAPKGQVRLAAPTDLQILTFDLIVLVTNA